MHRVMLVHPYPGMPSAWANLCKLPHPRVMDLRKGDLMGGSSLQDCNPKGGVHCSPPDVAKETMDAVRRENPNLLDQKERFTWVAKGSVLVVLIKAGPRTTVMYLPGSQTSFAASPCASLGEDCPTGTAFLGQVVMDRTPSPVGTDKKRKRAAEGEEQKTWLEDKEENTAVWRLNLLLFDILKYGAEIDFRTSKESATRRHSFLNELDASTCNVLRAVKPEHSAIKVQWAGGVDMLVPYSIQVKDTHPHVIECLLKLGSTDPRDLCMVLV